VWYRYVARFHWLYAGSDVYNCVFKYLYLLRTSLFTFFGHCPEKQIVIDLWTCFSPWLPLPLCHIGVALLYVEHKGRGSLCWVLLGCVDVTEFKKVWRTHKGSISWHAQSLLSRSYWRFYFTCCSISLLFIAVDYYSYCIWVWMIKQGDGRVRLCLTIDLFYFYSICNDLYVFEHFVEDV